MKSSILEKLHKLLSGTNISLISLFITVIITMVLMRIDAYLAGFGGKGAFYLQVAFTKSNFMEVLSSWRSGGVDLLIGLIWLNYIYAVSYAVLFASAMAFFSAARRKLIPALISRFDLVTVVLPFAAALFDWISNTMLYLLFTGRSLKEELIMASSILSSMKWALVVLSLAIILKSYFSFRKAMKGGAPTAP